MDAIERAVPAPQIEIIVQGRAWRQVFRNRAPLAARAQDVHQTVSNLAQVHRALITTRLGRREAWLDQRPLRIGQVAWIAQVVAGIAGTIFGRPHRQRLPQNQAATLESQPIHPIQYLPGQTLTSKGVIMGKSTNAITAAIILNSRSAHRGKRRLLGAKLGDHRHSISLISPANVRDWCWSLNFDSIGCAVKPTEVVNHNSTPLIRLVPPAWMRSNYFKRW